MKKFQHFKSLSRAIAIIATMIFVVSGVTYAALQSQQAKLTGNQIQTAIANLQISSDGTTYSNTQNGFSFANLIPGGAAVPANGYNFFLKNAGGTALALTLAVSSTPTNADNVNLSKVHVLLTPVGAGPVQDFTLQSLITGAAIGGMAITSLPPLHSGAQQQFNIQVSMEADAITGPSATIANVDFSFGGFATN